MTGEMHSINQKGEDSNGEVWSLHAAIARAVKGKLKPFDVYQGPYIAVGNDYRVGSPPYDMPVQGLGIVRLWLSTDGGGVIQVWREDTDTLSAAFWWNDTRKACREARKLLAV